MIQPIELKPKIRNIVALIKFERDIDLLRLTENTEGIVYEPEIFPAGILHHKNWSMSMLIFASGKIIIAGASNP